MSSFDHRQRGLTSHLAMLLFRYRHSRSGCQAGCTIASMCLTPRSRVEPQRVLECVVGPTDSVRLADRSGPNCSNGPTNPRAPGTNITMEFRTAARVVVDPTPVGGDVGCGDSGRQCGRVGVLTAALLALLVSASCAADPATPSLPSGSSAAPSPVNSPLDAYRNYFRVSDAARRSPLAQDWRAQFVTVAADPELARAVSQWEKFRDLGVIFFGDTVLVNPQISAQTNDTATVEDCQDETGVTAQQSGRALPNDPNQIRRGRATTTISLVGTTWVVSQLQLHRDQPC